MKGRDLSKYRQGNIPKHGAIDLGVPESLVIEAAGEENSATCVVELDLAVAPDDDVVGLLFPARAIYDAGLCPVVPVEVISANTPVRVCALTVVRPSETVTLVPGTVLARLVLLETAGRPIHHDPYMPLHASPDDLPFMSWSEQDDAVPDPFSPTD